MFKKRYLPILLILLSVIGFIVLSRIAWHEAYAACIDELSSDFSHAISEGYQFKYAYTSGYLPSMTSYSMFFDDGEGGVWCHAYRQGLEWGAILSPVSIEP